MVGDSAAGGPVLGEPVSGAAGWPHAVLAPGAVLAGYRLEQRIGAGGMAVVFRARDERLGRTVALKVVAPTLAGDDGFRERFIRESRAAAAVDHPHIIPVYGAGEAAGVLYLAMRYVSGGDLHSVMRREGPLPAERAAFLLSPVASALDAAHAAGLAHRDVKPANVLVDMSPGRPDHPYLSDFGLAKGTGSVTGLTGTGQFIGTVDYAAPEQISGGRAYVQTDQYALACVAFTMLTGMLPFARDVPMAVLWAHLNDRPPSVAAHRPDLSATAVDQVLGRALAKDPAARYPSCGAFADALRAALGVGPYSVPAPQHLMQQHLGQQHPGQSARGEMPAAAPGASAAHSAPVPFGWTTEPGPRAPATGAPTGGARVTGGPMARGVGSGAPPASAPRLSRKLAGRRRGLLVAASAVVLAGAAVLVAVFYHPAATPPVSGGSAGGQATPQGRTPKAAASATGSSTAGEASVKPGDSGAVTGSPVRFTNPGSVPNVATALTSDGSLVTVGTNGTVYVWDTTARQVTDQMSAPRVGEFQGAAISPDGDTVAVQASGGTTYIFRGGDTPDATLPAGERLYPGSIPVAGLTIATGDAEGTGTHVWVGPLASAPSVTLTNPDGGAALTSVAISVDSAMVAASDDSGRTDLWNANNGKRTHVLEPKDGSDVSCSVFSDGSGALDADDGVLVTGDRDGRAYLWNATTGALIRSVHNPNGAVDTVAISFGGSLLATAGTSGAVYLWDATTGASLGTISDPGGAGATALSFDTDSSQLAVADKNGTTYVWTLAE